MNSGKTILLVDDEEEFVTTLAERLEIRGFNPEAATSGQQALERIENRDFDLVVLDLKMPGIGGLEVMDRIKAKNPDLPVILLTGQDAAEDGAQGIGRGAFDYLIKPLDIDGLIAKIHEALGNKQS